MNLVSFGLGLVGLTWDHKHWLHYHANWRHSHVYLGIIEVPTLDAFAPRSHGAIASRTPPPDP